MARKIQQIRSVVEVDIPTSHAIIQVEPDEDHAKVHDGVDDSHGKGVNGANVLDENCTVGRGKSLPGRLLEEVHGHYDTSSLQVDTLEEFHIIPLFDFLFQSVLKGGELFIDLRVRDGASSEFP